MSWQVTRLDKMNAAVTKFLLEDLPDGSRIGIVAYSTEAHVLAEMTLVRKYNGRLRKELVNKLPQRTDLYTATGKGLLKGLEVFHIVNLFVFVKSFLSNESSPNYSDTL